MDKITKIKSGRINLLIILTSLIGTFFFGINALFVIFSLWVLFAVINNMLEIIKKWKEDKKSKKKQNLLLSPFAIFVYILIYMAILAIDFFPILGEPILASFMILSLTYMFLLSGLMGISGHRLVIGLMRELYSKENSRKISIIFLIIAIIIFILALFILFYSQLLT